MENITTLPIYRFANSHLNQLAFAASCCVRAYVGDLLEVDRLFMFRPAVGIRLAASCRVCVYVEDRLGADQ